MFSEKSRVQSGISEVKNILLVAAGKGGVGKSVVAANLALALKSRGFRVGLLDADVYGPSLKKMLTIDRYPSREDNVFIPALAAGLPLMSMAFFRDEEEAAAVRAPIANSLIKQLIHEVQWGKLDYLIVDTPPGTGDIPITLAQQLPISGAVLVSTPQEVALLDVKKVITMLTQVNVPLLGFLENMSYFLPPGSEERLSPFGSGGVKAFASKLGIPFLGELPIDPDLCRLHDQGQHVFSKGVNSPIETSFIQVVSKLEDILKASVQHNVHHFSLVCQSMPLKEKLKGQLIVKESIEEAVCIRDIKQRDETSFSIEWVDGKKESYHFSEIQRLCPCAGCVDEQTGKRLVQAAQIEDSLRARALESVGRYALRIKFTSGCSNGIYSYPFLHSLERNEV